MKNSIFALALLITLVSCDITLESPFDKDDQTVYIIKKGHHDSNRTPKSFESGVLSFQAKFDETAIYQTQTEYNQEDINKLMGFSACNSHHQENSARFGWRWFNNQLEIHAYCYVEGTRVSEYITSVDLDKTNDYKIEALDGKYVFTVNSVQIAINKNEGCTGNSNYMLFPYFGGDETAPHDIAVTVIVD